MAPNGLDLFERVEWLATHDLDGAPVPSRSARLELLEAAVVFVAAEMGCPLNDAAEAAFGARVDALYRASLVARVPMRRPSFETRLRAAWIEHRANAL